MSDSPNEARKVGEQRTRRAVADAVRRRLCLRRQKQTDLAKRTGISRTHIRSILSEEKSVSLPLFLELSRGLGILDPCELLRDILNRRDGRG